jgi:hypothetical protein
LAEKMQRSADAGLNHHMVKLANVTKLKEIVATVEAGAA